MLPATEHGNKQRSEMILQGQRGSARGVANRGMARLTEGQQRDASVAGTWLRSGGRGQDKAARGKGLGCACNAAARRLAAHFPSRPRQQQEEEAAQRLPLSPERAS